MKTVVLLQGFPEAFLSKKTLIHSYFEDNKYRIVLPDLNSESLFDSEFVLSDVESKLDGKSPDVIVGVSMGGLLAPVLANRYPKSKLVLVATGPYFKTKISAYNLLVALEARDEKTILIRILRLIPRGLFRFAYKNFNRSSTISDVEYAQRADENFDGVMSIPVENIKLILKFVSKTNNTNVLGNLLNRTLIFAGKSDLLMPLALSRQLQSLLQNSQLIVNERNHHDVFTKSEFVHLDKFLS